MEQVCEPCQRADALVKVIAEGDYPDDYPAAAMTIHQQCSNPDCPCQHKLPEE